MNSGKLYRAATLLIFSEVKVTSEQLFSEVEVNRPGYSPPSRECGELSILVFSPTLRRIIILAYTNQ